jgi:hypothetical protein
MAIVLIIEDIINFHKQMFNFFLMISNYIICICIYTFFIHYFYYYLIINLLKEKFLMEGFKKKIGIDSNKITYVYRLRFR